jgi:hypothetical protein
MYASKIRYLASAFVDAESVVASPTHALEFLKTLGNDIFFPGIINEFSPTGPTPRLSFRTPDNSLRLNLLGKRFDFTLTAKEAEGDDLGEFTEFCKQAQHILAQALIFFQRKAHRLAAVQEGFLKQMDAHEKDEIAKRIFNFPHFYKQSLPFEWDWRSASIIEREFSGSTEPTNTITTIKRVQFQAVEVVADTFSETPSDRIRVDFDINTAVSNVVARFGEQQIHGFFDQAPIWHNKLSADVFTFVLGK